MSGFRFRLDYFLVASLLVNAGLLGFIVALLLVPGPKPVFMISRTEPGPGAIEMPQFGFENRLFLAQFLEQDAEKAAERARRVDRARIAFSDVLAQQNPQAGEIVARGEELKAAMDEVGEGFLDAIVAAVPKLDLEERRKLSAFFLRLPPADFIFSGPASAGVKGHPGLTGSPFGEPGLASMPSGEGEGVKAPAGGE